MENIVRAELHLHTKLSDEISTIGVNEIFSKATELGIIAVAFTNLNNVQDFPKIARFQEKHSELKVIYGAEVCYKWQNTYCRATLLVKNQEGIKDLYKIISTLENDGIKDIVNYDILSDNRHNLLVGSCGNKGMLYKVYSEDYSDAIKEETGLFYDYFEIFPTDSIAEKEVYKKIIYQAEKQGTIVVAANDAHYINMEDLLCVDILEKELGKEDCPKRRLLFAEEMVKKFDYLGEATAEEIVFKTPKMIADSIQKVKPLKEGCFMPCFEDAASQIAEICQEKAKMLYGNPLPDIVGKRLSKELGFIANEETASIYLLAKKLVDYAKENNCKAFARGGTGAAFAAYLLGITEINPLPAHYLCPECKYLSFENDVADGFDLPDRVCPICAKELKADGHSILAETFMGINGEKMPNIDLEFPEWFIIKAESFLDEIIGKNKTVQAGVVQIIRDNKAGEMIDKYERETGKRFTSCQKKSMIKTMCEVKCGVGIKPGGVMIIPYDMEAEDFTPLIQNAAPRSATHIDFINLNNTLIKQDVSVSDLLELIDKLEKATGKTAQDIKWNDSQIYKLFAEGKARGIPGYDKEVFNEMLLKVSPENFTEFIKVQGLAHGTNTWVNNGEKLLENGFDISKIPTLSDDVFNDLLSLGADLETAYTCFEAVRKGLLARKKAGVKLLTDFRKISAPFGEWYFDYCSNVRYSFPKAYAVYLAMNALRCAWFKVYYPKEFSAVCNEK